MDDALQIASNILARLDRAWNAADGPMFAAEFTEAADVVNLFGAHIHGRAAVAERTQFIFGTIFKGSEHRHRQLELARFLADGVVLAISSAIVGVPGGPLEPELHTRQTCILLQEHNVWRICAWQNTRIGGWQ